jgi:hypothetical protein
MLAASEKGVVITLEGRETEEIRRRRAHAPDDTSKARYIDPWGSAPRDNAQGGISGKRIQCFYTDVVGNILTVETKTSGVNEAGTQDMILFEH